MHENYVVIIHGTGGARALASVEVVSKQGNFIVEYYQEKKNVWKECACGKTQGFPLIAETDT